MGEEGEKKKPERFTSEDFERFGKRAEKVAEELRRIRREGEEHGKGLHEQFTLAVGTIGAITFAALVLVIENPKPFVGTGHILPPMEVLHMMESFLGLVCLLSVVSVLATSFVASGLVHFDTPLGWFGYSVGVASMCGFATAVVWVVGDVSGRGGEVLIAVFVVLFVAFFVALWLGLKKTREKRVEESMDLVFGSN